MKKGFTLIEMIAVIGLIAFLSLLILPNILNQLGNKKEQISENTKQIIYTATQLYISDNNITSDGSVKLSRLVTDGYLKSPLTDVNCDNDISLNKIVQYTKDDYNQFTFSIDLTC